MLAVVKADAYGHGAVEIARSLASAGAEHFAIACIEEGIELRRAGIAGGICVLSGLIPGTERDAAEHSLTPFIHTAEQLQAWQTEAASRNRRLPCHLEIDTGMTRTGLSVASAAEAARLLSTAPQAAVEGIATHLATAENFADGLADQQIARFTNLVRELAAQGIRPRFRHYANSAAIAYRRTGQTNMVRPGLALYGYVNRPAGKREKSEFELEPALEWKAKIVAIRDVAPGTVLGYDATFRAERAMRIGVVSAGYGDGLDRRMSNGGMVRIGTSECSIVGLISMDVTLIDLTNAPHAVTGDDVTLIGNSCGAERMADRCGTIPYEILCRISMRVPRVYY